MGADDKKIATASLREGDLVLDVTTPVQGFRNSQAPIS
jgi:hypothetical protein